MPNVFTISASTNFTEALALGVIDRVGREPLALADVTIFLPTRRAARTFGHTFARLLGGAALLPEFRPLGEIDDEELFFADPDTPQHMPPAISRTRQRFLLAALTRRWCKAERGEDTSFVRAHALADSLCKLLDEAETQEIDLETLDHLVDGPLAKHWSETRDFLRFLRVEWPKLLATEGAMGPAARRNAAIRAVADQIGQLPRRLVIAAGSTGSVPVTADLLAAIANLPNGAVVLPGLDRDLDDSTWWRIGDEPGHPQYGLKQLVKRLDVARADIRDWVSDAGNNTNRERLLREVLRPAPTTDAWRAVADGDIAPFSEGMKGLSLIEASDASEEATAIALLMRESLEHRDQRAALITADRTLARRVAAQLRRWDIEVDDSAGLPLARTPPGAFLCLVADAAEARFAPVPLLAMLRHPLAAQDADRQTFLRRVRQLDVALRGPRPDAGLSGILEHISGKERLRDWFDGVATFLRPFESLMNVEQGYLPELIDAHVHAAEFLAGGGSHTDSLWQGEAGEAARALREDLRDSAGEIPLIETSAYATLFRILADEVPVRPQQQRHPRLAILGPLEARLHAFDLTILGGLNEGSWPRLPAADPWLSRPMRLSIGLDSPDRIMGLSAHDFSSLAAQPRVVLTRAKKVEGAPTVASRWIQRLQQFARGLSLEAALMPPYDWCSLARALHANTGTGLRPAERPAPAPPVETRPRRLRITEIERWRRDPYAIYARHILALEPLEELDAPVGALERGNIVHRALEAFVKLFPRTVPDDAVSELLRIATELLDLERIPKSVIATWKPRFAHAARWFVDRERERRALTSEIFVEVQGELSLAGPAGPFKVHGRADRIDLLAKGGASIIDYKTGAPPTDKQVRELLSPQLPIEAAILRAGGFSGLEQIKPEELVYVRFSGGADPGSWKPVNVDVSDITDQALALLSRYIVAFDDPAKGYLSRAIPFRSDFAGDYDHLARHGEWTTEVIEDVEEW